MDKDAKMNLTTQILNLIGQSATISLPKTGLLSFIGSSTKDHNIKLDDFIAMSQNSRYTAVINFTYENGDRDTLLRSNFNNTWQTNLADEVVKIIPQSKK